MNKEDLEIRAIASNADGTYAQGSCKFKIENAAVAIFTVHNDDETADDITVNFQDRVATAKVKGISKGKTDIIAVSKIDDKDLSDIIAIEVTESASPS